MENKDRKSSSSSLARTETTGPLLSKGLLSRSPQAFVLSVLFVAVYGQGYGYGGARQINPNAAPAAGYKEEEYGPIHLQLMHSVQLDLIYPEVLKGVNWELVITCTEPKETPKPYEFSYEVKDEFGNQHHRQESGDESGTVQGAYGYTDALGLFRQVQYQADGYGFKATVKTNEPGTDNQSPADVEVQADPSPIKYEAPKKAYAPGPKTVANAPSYQAPTYRVGGPLYGPSVAHRSGYIAPRRTVSKTVTKQRGYAPNRGYGHTTKVVSHEANYLHPIANGGHIGAVAHLEPITNYKEVREYSGPVHHGVGLTQQRGYDRHDGGYGHASRISLKDSSLSSSARTGPLLSKGFPLEIVPVFTHAAAEENDAIPEDHVIRIFYSIASSLLSYCLYYLWQSMDKDMGLAGAQNNLGARQINPGYTNTAPAAAYKGEEYKETPKPYEFSYEVKDEFGNQHHRQESGDEAGTVQGAYGYTDALGLFRQVQYQADGYGFKATVKTNEPGTDNQSPADVLVQADPSPIKVGGPLYGPSVAHRSGYIAPRRTVSKTVTKQRGYAPSRGYGQTTKVVSHEANYLHPIAHRGPIGGVAHLEPLTHALHKEVREYSGPVHHGVGLTQQRGYDRHDGGYGHASRIATIILALVAVTLAQYHGAGRKTAVHSVHNGNPGYGHDSHAVHATHATHGYAAPAKHAVRPAYSAHAPSYKQDDYEEAKPYEFGFNTKDEYDTTINRQESGDGYGNVKGSYGYTDAYGLYRQVEYTADDYGFKAHVKTNEPGTSNQNPADVEMYAEPAAVKYDSAPKKGYNAGHKAVVAHAPSYGHNAVVAHAPSYGHRAVVAHSGSYAAPAYGHRASHAAPSYGHRASYAAPSYGHQASYAAPSYGHHASYAGPAHKTAHVSTHRRGYDAKKGGYGHDSHVTTHSAGYRAPVHHAAHAVHSQGYAAPARHGVSYANTHQRGYDSHNGGYGHASHVVAHKTH
ncbi:Cuticle protein 16.8 [Nymphon striatum]|nr:Cuticle protein 16.8 [Nymphon striatum]